MVGMVFCQNYLTIEVYGSEGPFFSCLWEN